MNLSGALMAIDKLPENKEDKFLKVLDLVIS
jgi:hypothetical protein